MSVSALTENSATPVVASAIRKAVLWIVAVFVLGIALGGVSGYVFAHRVPAAPSSQLSDEARRHQKVAMLTSLLSLTSEQQAQINAIFIDTSGQFQAIHKQSDAQIDAVRQKTRDRTRAVLTPEQLPKFEEYLRKLDEERKNHAQPH
jgi:Spy/CpxP family protein refolding chaperone